VLATIHRPRNADNPARLQTILAALEEIAVERPVVLPTHPRTYKALNALGYRPGPELRVIDPVSYLDMLALEKHARLILTDSGGVQKEAYFFAVPCLTLREETEWVETVDAGWNRLVGADRVAIVQGAREFQPSGSPPQLFGEGSAAEQIVALLTGQGT
jgi:UDP-N-acetylglucosamine 2-epimerase (non-hydrolysing)/UDP-GlcNAc3NAcA epimerase